MSNSGFEVKEELWRQIREIQDRHRRELEPLLNMLSRVQELEPPAPIFLDLSSMPQNEREYWEERLKSIGGQLDETN